MASQPMRAGVIDQTYQWGERSSRIVKPQWTAPTKLKMTAAYTAFANKAIMAITDLQISEELMTDAPSIKYRGDEGPKSPQEEQQMLVDALL